VNRPIWWGAQISYVESLALSRRLARADPSKALRQGEVRIGLERPGHVLRDQRDFSGTGFLSPVTARELLAGEPIRQTRVTAQ